ncbi:MAG: glycosyltransferase [Lentisphaeria bacterium]|nr:glycosyltransferase [Lentisphaeria bacterium]
MPEKPVIYVLPSLDPDERILELVNSLEKLSGQLELLVIDDGSCVEKQPIFDQLALQNGCTVIHHEKNKGKGAALKTAFRYLLARYGEDGFSGCVTADGDGQHLPEDILHIGAELQAHPRNLVLGSRVFTGDDVPWKSRFGNHLTSFMFRKVLRLNVTDTQTGLRGIPPGFMKACLALPGDRFEFETEMLLATKKAGYSILEFPIQTVYFDENSGTHFHPVKDACRIYGVIFHYLLGEFFTFVLSSLSAALLDYLLFCLVYYVFLGSSTITWDLPFFGACNPRLFLSVLGARVCSSLWSFTVNRYVVFRKSKLERQPLGKSLAGYYLLCAVIFVASWLLTAWVSRFMPVAYGKPLVDVVLFLLCFIAQKFVIFRRKQC